MTLRVRTLRSVILASLIITAGCVAEHSRVRSLFENAVKDTGGHGQIPVLVPTALPKELAIDATAVVNGTQFMGVPCNSGSVRCESLRHCDTANPCINGESVGFGYVLALFAHKNAFFSVGTFRGTRMDPAAPVPRNSGSLRLANGAIAYYSLPQSSLWWRTGNVEYNIHLQLDAKLSERRKLEALVKVANSMVVSSKQ